jgi:hypothetical protein
MQKVLVAVTVAGAIVVVTFFGYPLLRIWLEPCSQIFEQTVTKVHADVDLLSKKGGMWLETAQVQNLSERSERMGMALKACCIAQHDDKFSPENYRQCQIDLKSYDQQIEQVTAALDEAHRATQRKDNALAQEKVQQANSFLAAANESARKIERYVPTPPTPPVTTAPTVAPTQPAPTPTPTKEDRADLLGWRDPHLAGYNDNFQHATLIDSRAAIMERIETQGDRDYYVLRTGTARGTLRVRFEQTGLTSINPYLEFRYGGEVRSRGQAQPGTDLTEDFHLDGESDLAYVGVWDGGDDAFSDTPYRLSITHEGEGELPDAAAAAMPIRFDFSKVERKESEPNDDHFKATGVRPGEYIAGRIGTKGDMDFYKIDVKDQAGGTLMVKLQQVDATPIKPKLVFFDGDRAETRHYEHPLSGMDLSGQQKIDKKHSVYYVAVSDRAGNAETDVPYILHIELAK